MRRILASFTLVFGLVVLLPVLAVRAQEVQVETVQPPIDRVCFREIPSFSTLERSVVGMDDDRAWQVEMPSGRAETAWRLR